VPAALWRDRLIARFALLTDPPPEFETEAPDHVGMFVGATLLALAWEVSTGWVDENPDATTPPDPSVRTVDWPIWCVGQSNALGTGRPAAGHSLSREAGEGREGV
jgi:hypothetical protein